MASKPSIPKGTRDFSPAEVAKRQYIMQIIRANFEKFGFQPIETPSFENSDTLMGKYGEEGDRLIFKILNSGDFLKDVEISSKYFKEILKKSFEHSFLVLYDTLYKDYEGDIDVDFEFGNAAKDVFYKAFFENELFVNSFSEKLSNKIRSEYLRMSNSIHFAIVKYLLKSIKDERNFLKYALIFSKAVERTYFRNVISGENFKDVANKISEKALRYDLTVPFARYVVQHQNEIEFPFRRYQIQPVWRADRPQKGRYREFFQCDADVVGSTSLWQEIELVQLYDAVYHDLGLNGVTIKINNRKILSGIAEVIGASDKLIDFTVALDKLDKIGEDGVKKEMLEKGISAEALTKVQSLFSFSGSLSDKISQLREMLSSSEEGIKGVDELQFICENVTELGLKSSILNLDVTLARGLNYYTGAIFEVAPPKEVSMGSIGGGGRYDDLTGIFGLKNMSGVGISFGLDRTYLVLEELNLFPETVKIGTKALFVNYGMEEAKYAMKAVMFLRSEGIKVEMFPDAAKLNKQIGHADKRNIPFVVIAGSNEMKEGKFALKNLLTGEQTLVTLSELLVQLQ